MRLKAVEAGEGGVTLTWVLLGDELVSVSSVGYDVPVSVWVANVGNRSWASNWEESYLSAEPKQVL